MAKTYVSKPKAVYARPPKKKADYWKAKNKGSSHSGGRKQKAWWEGNPVEVFKDGKTQWVSTKYSTKLG